MSPDPRKPQPLWKGGGLVIAHGPLPQRVLTYIHKLPRGAGTAYSPCTSRHEGRRVVNTTRHALQEDKIPALTVRQAGCCMSAWTVPRHRRASIPPVRHADPLEQLPYLVSLCGFSCRYAPRSRPPPTAETSAEGCLGSYCKSIKLPRECMGHSDSFQ